MVSTIFGGFGAKDRIINWGPGVVSVKVAPTLHNETSHLRRASKLQSRLIPIQTATGASRRPLWRGRSRQGRRESSPTRRGGSLINGIGCATCHTSSISDAYAVHHGYFGLDDLGCGFPVKFEFPQLPGKPSSVCLTTEFA